MAEETEQDDKTEDPSQRKLDKALERGDVIKSQDVGTLFLLAATLAMMALAAGPAAGSLINPFTVLLQQADRIALDAASLRALWWQVGEIFVYTILLPGLALALAAIAGNMIQHAPVLSGEQVKPKLSKISPIAGFKRLFGLDAWVAFFKGVLKIIVVVAALVLVVWPYRDRLDLIVALDIVALLPMMQDLAVRMLIAVVIIMAVIAGADYIYQRQRYLTRQRMSRKEVKDEYKETEGSPEIKQKIRQLRNQRARRRMMAEVPKATVVITNPTHYAIALRYDEGMPAPTCIAKGVDAVALRIRTVATEAGVPIVENPPLARALYAGVELDAQIPEEHYRAVAEVIGFVMRMRKRG
jgi:flagellar biosynthetic protein FlhB